MSQKTFDSGWIEVICGCMFSGKTEELIRRLRRTQIAKLKTIIFKPKIDERYSENHIVSHNNMKMDSHQVNHAEEILSLAKHSAVVGIDEVQFFPDDIIDVCKSLAKQNKRVIAAGLDTDYRGIPFGPMPTLMCEADYLDKFRAICVICGKPASYTHRKTRDTKQIILGEMDVYEARCRNCYELTEETI